MSRWYVDTSAALKLLVEEPESAALAAALDAELPDLVACLLVDTELRRVSQRVAAVTQQAVSGVLERIDLYEVPPSLFTEAGLEQATRLKVAGMTCGHCEASVRREVSKLTGVQDVQVSAAAGTLKIVTAAELADEAVLAAVDEAGYTAARA